MSDVGYRYPYIGYRYPDVGYTCRYQDVGYHIRRPISILDVVYDIIAQVSFCLKQRPIVK